MDKRRMELLQLLGFLREVGLVKGNGCPFCGKEIDTKDFKNEISRKEYLISGLCQDDIW